MKGTICIFASFQSIIESRPAKTQLSLKLVLFGELNKKLLGSRSELVAASGGILKPFVIEACVTLFKPSPDEMMTGQPNAANYLGALREFCHEKKSRASNISVREQGVVIFFFLV